jgi:hypothetical protein
MSDREFNGRDCDGKIAEFRGSFDMFSMLQQLGAAAVAATEYARGSCRSPL